MISQELIYIYITRTYTKFNTSFSP